MVLGKDNLGVEEIRGTGHPSWQVYNQARGATMAPGKEGEGPGYAGAVEKWKTNLTNQANETERERIKSVTGIEAARVHGAGNPYLASLAAHADLENQALQRQRFGTAFDKLLQGRFGKTLPKEGEPAYAPYIDARNWELEHPGEGEKRYEDNITIQKADPLFTPENLAKHGLPPIPEGLQNNPEALRALKLQFIPKLSAPAAAPGVTPPAPTGPWAEAGAAPLDLSGIQTIGPNAGVGPGAGSTLVGP